MNVVTGSGRLPHAVEGHSGIGQVKRKSSGIDPSMAYGESVMPYSGKPTQTDQRMNLELLTTVG